MEKELSQANRFEVKTQGTEQRIELEVILYENCVEMQDIVMKEVAECQRLKYRAFSDDPYAELVDRSELVGAPISGFVKLKERQLDISDAAVYERIVTKHAELEHNSRTLPLLNPGQWLYLAKVDGIGIGIYIVPELKPAGSLNKNIELKLQEILDNLAADDEAILAKLFSTTSSEAAK